MASTRTLGRGTVTHNGQPRTREQSERRQKRIAAAKARSTARWTEQQKAGMTSPP